MAGEFPEFRLQLPKSKLVARGWLKPEKGSAKKPFVVAAGSPVRATMVRSFATRKPTAYHTRQRLIADGAIRDSESQPGWLETTRDITCSSPSAAASILMGCSVNGLGVWRGPDGRSLAAYLGQAAAGSGGPWLIRGSNVNGLDLVRRLWHPKGLVSLAASRLRQGVAEDTGKDELRAFVGEDYEAATYAQKQQLVEELHTFLSRMKPGDTVCTISSGELYVGEISGDAEQTESEDQRSNLRRRVDWQPSGYPYDGLPEELQQKLSIQHDVIDLSAVGAIVEGLGLTDAELKEEAEAIERDPTVELPALVARRELKLPDPTDALAAELLVHDIEWLREVRDLLADERQLVLYGPPGTGKTYLALKLAEFLGGGPEQVKLVQFHPAYAYEDFVEGFRPKEDPDTKEVAFRLNAGPLRTLADLAGGEGNRHIPHFLIIDEINRANLAKVFGELYFLLEYRNRSVQLPYSGADFALPPNLFVIGTMNTADRSIALVDAAMRRRFAFVELSPRTEPTSGLLRRWLAREGKDAEPAELLDALNARIDDPDFRIGPSYLMKKGVHREGGLERTWRTKILPLLEEHHYGEGVDIEKRYGLAALRKSLG
ncbi:DUF4357 domain-containing protein [Streptomyces sp. NPDC056716]|uniref:DUF4357 domain-containing protein n=1 Tax=unclassified Streptomyces TaxID=2593676 RepID=UPI0036A55B2C